MIDIHSHLIYEVDDGPATIKESIRMVLEAEKIGIQSIIATPHFHENIYSTEKVIYNFNELVHRTRDCGVELYLGYEVFINTLKNICMSGNMQENTTLKGIPQKDMSSADMTQKVTDRAGTAQRDSNQADMARKNASLAGITLGGSRYLLFELPFDSIPAYSYETIYTLNLENIIPVIAHPERNRSFVRSFGSFISFIEKGCLLQVDAASIIGIYGTEVRSFTKRLIKLKLANFIASDAHCSQDYIEWYVSAYNTVCRWAGIEYAEKLFYGNPMMIVDQLKK
ncbi:MAG TPA: phosphoesterase [Clostridiales bacterium]|nr:phosphoesterase [Clostridiales bacterium]